MLRILADGEQDHRVEGPDGTAVGWIRGRAIGFRGFADESQAVAAATVASRSLDGALRRQFPGWALQAVTGERLRIAADGTGEWIADGDRRLARLYRLADARPHDAARGLGPLAIELELPTYASEGIVIAAAHVVGAAIQKHVDWARAPGPPGGARLPALDGAPA